jgi:hypothetical protein
MLCSGVDNKKITTLYVVSYYVVDLQGGSLDLKRNCLNNCFDAYIESFCSHERNQVF